jgi:hypothetical protein
MRPAIAATRSSIIGYFAADNAAVVSVDRGGARLVDQGRHRERERIAGRYRKTLARLIES